MKKTIKEMEELRQDEGVENDKKMTKLKNTKRTNNNIKIKKMRKTKEMKMKETNYMKGRKGLKKMKHM